MRKFLMYLSMIISLNAFGQYTSCSTANSASGSNLLENGECLTNQNATTNVPMANCWGGSGGYGFYYPFIAGNCSEFTMVFNSNEEVQFLLYNSSCNLIAVECANDAQANTPISESFSSITGGTPALTPGTKYILEVITRSTSNFSICFEANATEEPSNECAGALGLSPTGATFYNGGNCSFSGSYNDATTSDPTPSTLCAGSLENTQWITFQPTAGSTSFQIIGSNISCGGPICKWQFGIFSGSCASLTPEGCVSSGNACANGPDQNSISSNPAGGNNTYSLIWNSTSTTGFTTTITNSNGSAFNGTEVFYLVMDGNANSDCQYTLAGVNIQPLPIELVYIIGKKYNNVNYIEWKVASQINNDYFTIERSSNGIDWYDVYIQKGEGNTTQEKTYTFFDKSYSRNINYYRLKQTDYNGASEHSKIISIDNRIKNRDILKVINLMGQEVDEAYKGLVIIHYSNGDIEKTVQY